MVCPTISCLSNPKWFNFEFVNDVMFTVWIILYIYFHWIPSPDPLMILIRMNICTNRWTRFWVFGFLGPLGIVIPFYASWQVLPILGKKIKKVWPKSIVLSQDLEPQVHPMVLKTTFPISADRNFGAPFWDKAEVQPSAQWRFTLLFHSFAKLHLRGQGSVTLVIWKWLKHGTPMDPQKDKHVQVPSILGPNHFEP